MPTVRPACDTLKGHFHASAPSHQAESGQQLQVTEAVAPEEKDTEPLPLPRQMLSCRVTWT